MRKRYPSGAGGLYSTAGDYARFCQMLLNAGELDGARILGRKTVELLMANHPTLSPPGQFGWSGAAATWFTIDPQEELIAILMMQHLPRGLPRDPPRLGRPFIDLVITTSRTRADRD
jgi:CubicO group peptidase (beta-lactamase class C family)